ncbi:MAG: ComEC/Rec2 family competence protein [Patescibacteria group bacterium]|nr:ComEC/Rec2 family competence protein [Patescibacteria group bacterium]
MRSSFFIYLAFVFVVGIFVAATGQILFLLPALVFVFWRRPLFLGVLGGLVLVLAFFYHQEADAKIFASNLYNQVGQVALGRALITEDIDPGGNYQSIIAVYLDEKGRRGEKFLLKLPAHPSYHAGEVISFSGIWERPENWSEFRYDRYLARQDIYVLLNFPEAEKVGELKGFLFSIWHFKRKLYRQIISFLPEPEAGLAAALALGYKRTISAADKTVFSETGLSHLVAISGAHLSLLAGLFFLLLKNLKFSRRFASFLVIIFLWFYVILTGLSASALRSALMSSLILSGIGKRWQFSNGSLLLLSAALMLLANPLLLRDDLGFQLSYLAMLALIYGQTLAEAKLGKGPVRSLLILTILAQIVTWPVLALNFGRVSLVAPVANLLVTSFFVWLLPLLLSNIFISFFLPIPFLWVGTYLLLHYVFLLSHFLVNLPLSSVALNISPLGAGAYYLFIFGFYLRLKKKVSFKKSPQLEDFLDQFKNNLK